MATQSMARLDACLLEEIGDCHLGLACRISPPLCTTDETESGERSERWSRRGLRTVPRVATGSTGTALFAAPSTLLR